MSEDALRNSLSHRRLSLWIADDAASPESETQQTRPQSNGLWLRAIELEGQAEDHHHFLGYDKPTLRAANIIFECAMHSIRHTC